MGGACRVVTDRSQVTQTGGFISLFLVVILVRPSVLSWAPGSFLPGSLGTQAGIALQGGNCTNGVTGAFSNAALAAQALSDVSQAATIQSTQVTLDAVSARRRVEIEACPAGYVRRNEACERVAETAQPAPSSLPLVRTSAPAPNSRSDGSRIQGASCAPVRGNLRELGQGVR